MSKTHTLRTIIFVAVLFATPAQAQWKATPMPKVSVISQSIEGLSQECDKGSVDACRLFKLAIEASRTPGTDVVEYGYLNGQPTRIESMI